VLSNQILLFFVACGDCTKELPLTLSFYNAVFFSIFEDLCVTTAFNFTAIHKESRCGDCVRNLLEPVIFFMSRCIFARKNTQASTSSINVDALKNCQICSRESVKLSRFRETGVRQCVWSADPDLASFLGTDI
jgi:hypothetical protein